MKKLLLVLLFFGWNLMGQLPPLDDAPKIKLLLEDTFSTDRAAGSVHLTPADGRTPGIVRVVVDASGNLQTASKSVAYITIGDSKTAGKRWTAFIGLSDCPYWEVAPQLAVAGDKISNTISRYSSWIATNATCNPQVALIDIGANDVPSTTESAYKSDLATLLDSLHSDFPDLRCYVAHVWRGDSAGNITKSATLNTWIDSVLSTRPWCYAGHDESIWLPAVVQADQIHPTDPVGYVELARQWNLIIPKITGNAPGGLFSKSYDKSTIKYNTVTTNQYGTVYKATVALSSDSLTNSGLVSFRLSQDEESAHAVRIANLLVQPNKVDVYSDYYINNVDTGVQANTNYEMYIDTRNNGVFYLYGEKPKLVYISKTTNSVNTVNAILDMQTLVRASSVYRFRKPYYIYPLASDSFYGRSTLGTTDGMGHQEKNGGSGLTWSTSGTWNVGTNKAYGTQGSCALLSLESSDVIVDLQGSVAGYSIVVNADSLTNPQNYVGFSVDTDNKHTIYKVIAGVSNYISSGSRTFSAGGSLKFIKDGISYRGTYRDYNTLSATITDSAVTNNTYHGMITHSALSQITNICIWDVGNNGRYSGIKSLK